MNVIVNLMSKDDTDQKSTRKNSLDVFIIEPKEQYKMNKRTAITEEPNGLKVCRRDICGIVGCFISIWSCCLNSIEVCLHGCSGACICMSSGALLCEATLETIDCDKNPGACCC
jgi:hypothetical protein